jgi:hypothetical protein
MFISRYAPEGFQMLPGYPGYYWHVDGRIGCALKRGPKAYGLGKFRLLNSKPNIWGHEQLNLRVDGKNVAKLRHRIICEAAHGPQPTEQHEVCFKDGNKLNCDADNLEWVTPEEHAEHRGEIHWDTIGPMIDELVTNGAVLHTLLKDNNLAAPSYYSWKKRHEAWKDKLLSM